MDTYIIKYTTRINGSDVIRYHQLMSLNDGLNTTDVYIEHLSDCKGSALKFVDKMEAKKVANLFSMPFHIPIIIKY